MQKQKLPVKRFRKSALSMLLAAIMLFSSVDITALATELDTSTATETETIVTTEESARGGKLTDESDDVAENGQDKTDESRENPNPDNIDQSGQESETNNTDNPHQSDESDETQTPGGSDESTEIEDIESDEENSEEELTAESSEKSPVTIEQGNMSIEASNGLGNLLLD